MIALFMTILFGVAFAYFATQNTTGITIKLHPFVWPDIPLYLVILGSLCVGVILSWIIRIEESIASYLFHRRKEHVLTELKKTVGELIKRVHQLELKDNEKKKKNGEEDIDENAL